MLQEFPEILIIGYGNTLRSDDGIGQKVAEEVEKWDDPKVRSLYLHQLTPELALEMATAKMVIFVDAIKMTDQITDIELRKITVNEAKNSSNHSINPQYLLNLTHQLYQKNPLVFWLLIPVINFDFGEDFSPIALKGLKIALTKIRLLTEGNQNPK